MRLHVLTIILAITSLTFVACGEDADPKDGENGQTSGNNSTTNNGTTNNSTTTNNSSSTNNSTTTNNETCELPEPNVEPVDSCADGGYEACGWNGDCADTERCDDIGTVPNSGVTCCVTACRGDKNLGEECTTVEECNSGSCIGRSPDPNVCSRPCDSADDCPESLECVAIPFLEYPMWCVTPRSE